jgi:hypothetical protein
LYSASERGDSPPASTGLFLVVEEGVTGFLEGQGLRLAPRLAAGVEGVGLL